MQEQGQQVDYPVQWNCPITQEIMMDPVIANDGFTYQRKALQTWFKKSQLSPVTGAKLASKNLIPNLALKHTIEEFIEKNKNKQIKYASKQKQLGQKKLPSLLPLMEIKPCNPQHSRNVSMNLTPKNSSYLSFNISPPANPQLGSSRTPCSFICILDISQSMDTDSILGGKDVQSHGFSRLDLVKHSINTMVQFMQDDDEISLVPFSTSAKIVLNLTKTTKLGKVIVRDTLKNLETVGTTNIWDGFRVSMQLLKKLKSLESNRNVFVLLFTDGQPNLNPPRGIVPTLVKFLEIEKIPVPNIHVFGYGYQLDTQLLVEISEIGYGNYSYIPDCSMVGTVFINFMAAALATVSNSVYLQFSNFGGGDVLEKQFNVIGYRRCGSGYQIGVVQYGQDRKVVIKVCEQVLNKMKKSGKIVDIYLRYGCGEVKEIRYSLLYEQRKVQQSDLSDLLKIEYLQLLYWLSRQTKKNVEVCYKQIEGFYENLLKIGVEDRDGFILNVLKQLKNENNQNEGQVSKAYQKLEWYEKWGKHYIPSLYRSHLMEICTNFKDPAIQEYGGQLFKENQHKMDTIFIQMVPPQPTAKKDKKLVYKPVPDDMGDYYNFYGGCIHEDCLVEMIDGGLKKIHELRKGDLVKGGWIVVCMTKTPVFEMVPMTRIGNLMITPYHPVFIQNKWQFPCEVKCSVTMPMFVQCYYNFVLSGPSLICEGIECIGLGHGINDNDITRHSYFEKMVVQDLKRGRGWNEGQVVVRGWNREEIGHKVIGIIME